MAGNRSQRSLIALLISFTLSLAAAAATLRGVVTDPAGEPLPNASVRLLLPDSTYLRGVAADFDGRYLMRDVRPGRYLLQADYAGFLPSCTPVRVQESDTAVTLKALQLTERARMLGEVSVVGVKTQIRVKEDTVEYNADSYLTRPNAVVEDLLKRLPGVEVATDGSITANGRTVKKILVDGKEFFNDDPTVASKNIPVDIVDKLQVVDRKSDLARLTGVDDGEEETVINLTVKKGRNNGWFGNVEGGYGTDSRYLGQFTLNRFFNGNQLTLLGGLNNTNNSTFADGNAGRFSRFGTGGRGITETQNVGLNFNVGREEIIRVGGNVLFGHNDRTVTSATDRTYLLDNEEGLTARSGSRSNARSNNLRGDFRVLWKPDSFNTLELRPRFSINNVHTATLDTTANFSGAGTRLSHMLSTGASRGSSHEAGINLIYVHNFRNRPGRSFSINAGYSHSETREDAADHTETDAAATAATTDQTDDNHTWTDNISGRLTWTEPLGDAARGNFLSVAYRMSYRWNNADKLTYERDPASGTLILSERLSNRFRNDYFNQEIRLGYKHVNRTMTLDAGLSAVPQRSASRDLIDDARSIAPRSTFNVAPYLTLRLRRDKNSSLNLRYTGRASQPSLSQLQPVADESDPMNVRVGNPELAPSFRHDLRLRLQSYNAESQQSVMAMLNARVEQNTVASRTVIDTSTGARVTTYANVNGVWSAGLHALWSRPLGAAKTWLAGVHGTLGYDRTVGFNNGERNTSGTVRAGVDPSIAFRPATLDLELRPRYSLQSTSNSLAGLGSTTVHTYGGALNATWYSPFGLIIASTLDWSGTAGYASGYNVSQWLWDASIGWQFLADKSATVTLKGCDLLGQRSSVSREVTASYIDDIRTNTLTRYFMVTLSWTFNTFGKGKEPQLRDDGPGHRRRGPGPGMGPGGPPPGHGPR